MLDFYEKERKKTSNLIGLFIESSQPPLNVVHSQCNVRFTLHYKRWLIIYVSLIKSLLRGISVPNCCSGVEIPYIKIFEVLYWMCSFEG
jgi:hypothetical protein